MVWLIIVRCQHGGTLKSIEARGTLESMNGRISVGWLVVEEVIMVLVLVLLPPLSGWLGDNASLWLTHGITLIKVSAFIVFILAKNMYGYVLYLSHLKTRDLIMARSQWLAQSNEIPIASGAMGIEKYAQP